MGGIKFTIIVISGFLVICWLSNSIFEENSRFVLQAYHQLNLPAHLPALKYIAANITNDAQVERNHTKHPTVQTNVTKERRTTLNISKENLQQKYSTVATDAVEKGKVEYQRNVTLSYNQGKELVYVPITGCKPPQLLDGYSGNPCWKFNTSKPGASEVACAPKVVMLGIHKCGTTDIKSALTAERMISSNFVELYFNTAKFSNRSYCPTDLYAEEHYRRYRTQFRDSAANGKLVSNSCGGCFMRIGLVEETPTQYLVRSAVQLFDFYQDDKARYLISLRNPTDRVLSHYFYFLKIDRFKDIPSFAGLHTASSIGYDFFHELMVDVLDDVTSCLNKDGISTCLLVDSYDRYKFPMVAKMITIGCYSAYIEEIFKFIPKDRLYVNMLEEYGKQEMDSLRAIYTFIGLNSSRLARASQAESRLVRNQGLSNKPVHAKTIELLDNFYKPFNHQLAQMLGDEKWLYTRDL